MSTSTNELLEQGIQEVAHLSQRIVRLSEQEKAFQGVAGALEELHVQLGAVVIELNKLNCEREKKKWTMVWSLLGIMGGLQIFALFILILLSTQS